MLGHVVRVYGYDGVLQNICTCNFKVDQITYKQYASKLHIFGLFNCGGIGTKTFVVLWRRILAFVLGRPKIGKVWIRSGW